MAKDKLDTTKRADEELLNTLHQMVARDLINRIKSGEATVQELSAAIKYLKDNDVVADISYSKPLQQLEGTVMEVKELPFDEEDEDE